MEQSDPRREGRETVALLAAAREGDAESREALYHRLMPAVLAWASFRIEPWQRRFMAPEDLVQDVFLRVMDLIPGFSGGGSFRSWVFAIAKRVAMENRRKCEVLRSSRIEATESGVWSVTDVPADLTGVTKRFAKHEVHRRFVERISSMPAEDREIVIHCGLEGMTCREVAERKGIKPDTLEKRWRRLREQLADPSFLRFVEDQGYFA